MKLVLVKKLVLFVFALVFIFQAAGCESFARKFVRKPKPENMKKEEVVFAPEEYKSEGVSNQGLYLRFFSYWKAWQDELIDSLERNGNRKRQISSLNEAVKNLENVKPLINPESASKLDFYIKQLRSLREAVERDIYSNSVSDNRLRAERLKREIIRDFSFNNIQDKII
ncbi:MAG: hypothetical protein V1919_02470 [Candidatus Omnitrophota bacterium]